jgi:hypothetical protein
MASRLMAIKLNHRGFQHAKTLVGRRRVLLDEQEAWGEHRPTSRQRDAFIRSHGIRSYGTWFLGIDTDAAEGTKARHKYPYGDFVMVHRCAVLSAEVRAVQYKCAPVAAAAAHLHGMLDELIELPKQRSAHG